MHYERFCVDNLIHRDQMRDVSGNFFNIGSDV